MPFLGTERRKEGSCFAGHQTFSFLSFVPTCLPGSGRLVTGVTRGKESAGLGSGFTGLAPAQAALVGFKANGDHGRTEGLPQICQWHLCVSANAAKLLMGF